MASFNEFGLTNEEARALIVVRELGAITNADYRNISCIDTLAASSSLRRLRGLGLLEAKGKGSQTYYIPGKLINSKEQEAPQTVRLSMELTPQISGLPTELTPYIGTLSTEFEALPQELKEELERLGRRISPDRARSLILRLCEIKSFKLPALAGLLRRNAQYVRMHYLMPLIETYELEYVFPHQPNHPQQAYQAKRS